MTLKYTLKFFDYWHLSSGLSAGAKLDSSVVKDKQEMPYAPGKTIKGLVREMAELSGECDFIDSCFGDTSDKKSKCYKKDSQNKQGKCYFSNAVMESNAHKQIDSNKLQDNLYDVIASTQIDKNGIAVDNSLREIEVVIPISLYGEIRDIPDEFEENIRKALRLIKRMGLNRNRGLGRCEFIVEEKK